MSRKSKLQAMKKKTETLTLQMQFFCLDPKFEIFEEICKSNLSRKGRDFDLWKMAALVTYGAQWIKDEYLNEENNYYGAEKLFEYEVEFGAIKKKLLDQIAKNPTTSKIDQVWYMYFASGDANLILHVFKAAGNETTKIHLKEIIIDNYVQFTMEYERKIKEICDNNAYITGHQIGADRLLQTIKSFRTVQTIISIEQQKATTETSTVDQSGPSLDSRAELEKIILK